MMDVSPYRVRIAQIKKLLNKLYLGGPEIHNINMFDAFLMSIIEFSGKSGINPPGVQNAGTDLLEKLSEQIL